MLRCDSVLAAIGTLALLAAGSPAVAVSPSPGTESIPETGFAGLLSFDLPRADVRPVEQAVERALSRVTLRARDREETLALALADPGIESRLEEARRSRAAADAALRALDTTRAQEALDHALSTMLDGHIARLAPDELCAILDQRSRLAFARRDVSGLRRELVLEVPWQPEKRLDPRWFPPEMVEAYRQISATPRDAPEPVVDDLRRIAEAGGLRVVVAGDVARTPDGALIVRLYAIGDGDVVRRAVAGPAALGSLGPALDRALRDVLGGTEVLR